jgi:esterase/lipase superfamily enzyme
MKTFAMIVLVAATTFATSATAAHRVYRHAAYHPSQTEKAIPASDEAGSKWLVRFWEEKLLNSGG